MAKIETERNLHLETATSKIKAKLREIEKDRHRGRDDHPGLIDTPPPLPPVSSCSDNELGAEGATALSSGLTALTNLQSIVVW